MADYIELKALVVKRKIEEDLSGITEKTIEKLFYDSFYDKRVISFLNYYNRVILDKGNIDFGEFKHQWAIQGMKKITYKEFSDHFEERKKEIISNKNIRDFYNKYCRTDRNEAAFCCKLFHTILPNEFPPLDNPIRKYFKLHRIDFIDALLIIKMAYKMFIKDNMDKILFIRKILLNPKFSIIRVNDLSDFRLLDMYYWLMVSRNNKANNSI